MNALINTFVESLNKQIKWHETADPDTHLFHRPTVVTTLKAVRDSINDAVLEANRLNEVAYGTKPFTSDNQVPCITIIDSREDIYFKLNSFLRYYKMHSKDAAIDDFDTVQSAALKFGCDVESLCPYLSIFASYYDYKDFDFFYANNAHMEDVAMLSYVDSLMSTNSNRSYMSIINTLLPSIEGNINIFNVILSSFKYHAGSDFADILTVMVKEKFNVDVSITEEMNYQTVARMVYKSLLKTKPTKVEVSRKPAEPKIEYFVDTTDSIFKRLILTLDSRMSIKYSDLHFDVLPPIKDLAHYYQVSTDTFYELIFEFLRYYDLSAIVGNANAITLYDLCVQIAAYNSTTNRATISNVVVDALYSKGDSYELVENKVLTASEIERVTDAINKYYGLDLHFAPVVYLNVVIETVYKLVSK